MFFKTLKNIIGVNFISYDSFNYGGAKSSKSSYAEFIVVVFQKKEKGNFIT